LPYRKYLYLIAKVQTLRLSTQRAWNLPKDNAAWFIWLLSCFSYVIPHSVRGNRRIEVRETNGMFAEMAQYASVCQAKWAWRVSLY